MQTQPAPFKQAHTEPAVAYFEVNMPAHCFWGTGQTALINTQQGRIDFQRLFIGIFVITRNSVFCTTPKVLFACFLASWIG